MKFYYIFFFIFLNSFISSSIYARTKVSGIFELVEIKKNVARDYTLTFRPVSHLKKIKILVLNTDHVHSKIRQGDKIKLSAEVSQLKNGVASVAQMVLFYDSLQGKTPIWMMSKIEKANKGFNASKLLDVHSPQSDYIVF